MRQRLARSERIETVRTESTDAVAMTRSFARASLSPKSPMRPAAQPAECLVQVFEASRSRLGGGAFVATERVAAMPRPRTQMARADALTSGGSNLARPARRGVVQNSAG